MVEIYLLRHLVERPAQRDEHAHQAHHLVAHHLDVVLSRSRPIFSWCLVMILDVHQDCITLCVLQEHENQ